MTDEDKPRPALKIAAQNDQKSIKKHLASQEVGYALRELTANLIRVCRGAGRSYEIGRQCQTVVDQFHAYREVVEEWPSSYVLSEAIRNERNLPETFKLSAEEGERMYHEDLMVAGALQMVASRLLGQNTQERAGQSELYRGFNGLMEIRLEEKRAREVDQKIERKR